MHITFEALDKKWGMTLGELIENVEKAKKLTDGNTDFTQQVKYVFNFNGTIKQFEVEV